MTRLQQFFATLNQTTHRKLKPAVAVAALMAGSVFGGTAQAEILQLDLSGPSFSGYLFFDTSVAPGDYQFFGVPYYLGYSYISTPFATGSEYPYTTNPVNPFTGSSLANDASSSYHFGVAYLLANPVDAGGSYFYQIDTLHDDGSASSLSFFIQQSSSTNLLIDGPDSFAGADVTFALYNDGFFSNQLFFGSGTISLPAVTPPPVSAVPEPASWAMLLLGVGMVGGAARYRRRQAGTAASQYHFA